jgi:SAM-dependent methyltransferase
MPDKPHAARLTQQHSTRAWHANAAYWDDSMGEGNRWHLELVWPLIAKLLGDVEECRILDIGCGNGLSCRRLAAAGASMTGIDAAPAMLQRARDRSGGDSDIEYLEVDATGEDALVALGERERIAISPDSWYTATSAIPSPSKSAEVGPCGRCPTV